MQASSYPFTQIDLAYYPFLKDLAERIRQLDLRIESLLSEEMAEQLKRAEDRINEAICYLRVRDPEKPVNAINAEIEILSYPVALMLVAATENSFIKKRYALSEAKQAAYRLATDQNKDRVIAVARNFGWELSPKGKDAALPHDFSLSFADYSRNITHLQTDKKWKLVNRTLVKGTVYLNQAEVARLLEEEIKKHIEKRLEVSVPNLPAQLLEIVERIKKLAEERIGKQEMEGFPKVVVMEAFPPCINTLYAAAIASHHLSHMGRFTLTSFLVTIGMPTDKVAEVFKTFSDYNARLTRYQVGHIAGETGSGTKYTPPSCSTLQTHGVCVNSDRLCQRIHHPLSYYKVKQRAALANSAPNPEAKKGK